MLNELDVFGDTAIADNPRKSLLTDTERRLINIKKQLAAVTYAKNLKFNLGRKNKDGSVSDRNSGLIDFISACGIDAEIFIKSYLRQVQPFMIIPNENRMKGYFGCTIDASYKIPLWVEWYSTKEREQIISFHELNWYNKGYDTLYNKMPSLLFQTITVDDFVPVGDEGLFHVEVVRGFESIELKLEGLKVDNGYIRVAREEYDRKLLGYCNKKLQGLYDNLQFREGFTKTKQLAFTSHGDRLANQVSMLIDALIATNDMEITVVLDEKVRQLKSLTDYDVLRGYFIEKYHNYAGKDISGLFIGGISDD